MRQEVPHMVEQIDNPISKGSRTIARSGVKRDTRELVIACGYSVSGKYGYFICWEEVTDKGYKYADPILFKNKESERTYTQTLKQLEHLVEAYKS
jgi:hypothetical protein